jgi:hypothetical protein
MQLAGRLRSTTLGDLLGALYRESVTGTLELIEDRGRTHRVHLARGLVTAVEVDGASPSLAEVLRQGRAVDDDVLRRSLLRAMASQRLHGEVLVHDFHLSPSIVGTALRRQVQARLTMLESLADARVSFRVATRPPRGALLGGAASGGAGTGGGPSFSSWNAPLTAAEFLRGRRRARARGPGRSYADTSPDPESEASPRSEAPASVSASAWRILGLAPGASVADVKRAYRRLARSVHPDLHPGASAAERRQLELRFMEITTAYGALVA